MPCCLWLSWGAPRRCIPFGMFSTLHPPTRTHANVSLLRCYVARSEPTACGPWLCPAGASVRDHLLTSYQKAVVAVVAAQFGRKSLHRGREGVLDLAQQKGACGSGWGPGGVGVGGWGGVGWGWRRPGGPHQQSQQQHSVGGTRVWSAGNPSCCCLRGVSHARCCAF